MTYNVFGGTLNPTLLYYHLKPICTDSLSPPVLQTPLYLRTSRRYTNVYYYYYY